MTPFELITGIAGLIAFTLKMIELLSSMTESIPKSTQLLRAIRNLHQVLERVSSEYSITISSFPPLQLNLANSILRDCIQDIHCICKEYDILLRKVKASMGGLRQLRWKKSESERGELDRRLEAGKSTLHILLTQLSEERQRHASTRSLIRYLIFHRLHIRLHLKRRPKSLNASLNTTLSVPPPYMPQPQTTVGNLQIENTPADGGVGDVSGTAVGVASLAVSGMFGSMWRRRSPRYNSTLTNELAKC